MKKSDLDIHTLYEASVQSVDENFHFLKKAFADRGLKKPKRICEDFCGTARLASEWVQQKKSREAVGVDLDPTVLAWGETHIRSHLTDAQRERLEIVEDDVLDVKMDPVDAVLAFNFSYFIFKTRPQLLRYLQRVRSRLRPGGALILDFYGGYGSYKDVKESREVSGRSTFDGTPIPDFTYEWEQTQFNAITHDVTCTIHFDLSRKIRIENAFRYDWRLWTLPELQELLAEAGYTDIGIYTHGWDKNGESDDRFTRRSHFENEESWLAYLVAWNPS